VNVSSSGSASDLYSTCPVGIWASTPTTLTEIVSSFSLLPPVKFVSNLKLSHYGTVSFDAIFNLLFTAF